MMSPAAGVSSGGMNTSLHHTIRVLVATTGVTYKITLYPAELTYVRYDACLPSFVMCSEICYKKCYSF
jgi:hypothetical protein